MLGKFTAKKKGILDRLSRSNEEYVDASPKGSVDEEIKDLVDQINGLGGFVTTSSCAGRVTVYLEGAQKQSGITALNGEEQLTLSDVNGFASRGGKGGGKWLFSSHSPVHLERLSADGAILEHFGFSRGAQLSFPAADTLPQFVHFKFEPMILHILSSSSERAQEVLTAALQAGFRESGIGSILDTRGKPICPTVAVRSSGLALDAIVGFQRSTPGSPQIVPMVSESYLRTLVHVANDRFRVNDQRKARFRQALFVQEAGLAPDVSSHESRAARRERKHRKGLLKRNALIANAGALDGVSEGQNESSSDGSDDDYGIGLWMESEETQVTATCAAENLENADAI